MLPLSHRRRPLIANPLRAVALLTALLIGHSGALAKSTKIDIDTVPPGATVYLADSEGGETSLGQTPLTGKRVPRGQVTLRFELKGHKGLVETVDVGTKSSRFVFKLHKDEAPGVLVFSSHKTFHGATISVDGKVVGALPKRVSVPVGRHHASVTKDGYETWERWLDITDGQELPLEIVLVPRTASRASLLVTSSPSGASILVNGTPQGVTPTAVTGLTPGTHKLVLTLDGYTTFTQTVAVKDGAQSVVEATLEEVASRVGSIKVLTDVEGASVSLDGEPLGSAPATREGLAPGLHLVEANATGHQTARREVTVRAGETTVVRLSLPEVLANKPATVRVVTAAPDAKVSVDGGPETPVTEAITIQTAGTHFITVTAPNHSKWTKQITTTSGQALELVAELSPSGTLLVEVASGSEAEVLIDGALVGMTPFKGPVALGERKIVVRRSPDKDDVHTVTVAEGAPTSIKAFLAGGSDGSSAKDRPMPYSAKTVGTGRGSLDIGLGWPYIGEMRINGGITPYLDVGFTFRNVFDTMSEFEGRVKYTFARSKHLAAAAEFAIGGGGGSLDRNCFIFRTLVLGSLFIGDKVAMTARAGGLVFSDRLAPEGLPADPGLSPALPEDRRDTGLELHAGLSLEFAVSEEWNIFLLFDGTPIRTGSYEVPSTDGEPEQLKGRLLLYEGFAGDAKAQHFRAAAGATLIF